MGEAGLHQRQDEVDPEYLSQQVPRVDKSRLACLREGFEVATFSHLLCRIEDYFSSICVLCGPETDSDVQLSCQTQILSRIATKRDSTLNNLLDCVHGSD